MMRFNIRPGYVFPVAAALLLGGCTAIDLSRLQPRGTGTGTCVAAASSVKPRQPILGSSFAFVLPAAVQPTPADGPPSASPNARQASSFGEYMARAATTKSYLPKEIRDDQVANALFAWMGKTSAEAQISIGVSGKLLTPSSAAVLQKQVDEYPAPTRLTHGQLKDFADKLFDAELLPSVTSSAPSSDSPPNPFAVYFTDYYRGKFVDRLGQAVDKPKLSLTVPDTEISAALTVLIEYMLDLWDPTPVLGSDDLASVGVNTKFYPGGDSKSRPTAYKANVVTYQQISASCGVTPDNIGMLVDVANAAGDRAAAIGGLVANTPGGISVGLGVIGKLSIGDNQTLSTIVKTTASRFAKRLTYAFAYGILSGSSGKEQRPGDVLLFSDSGRNSVVFSD